MRLNSDYREQFGFPKRVMHVALAMACGFLLLTVQFARLQLWRGDVFDRQSLENSIRLLRLPGPRGRIVDAQGHTLVDNRPAFALDFIPGEAEDPDTILTRIAQLIPLDIPVTRARIAAGSQQRFAMHRLLNDLTLQEVLPLQERMWNLPGILINVEPQRRVIHDGLAAHVIGTLGEINEKELRTREGQGYQTGDLIGKGGLEALLETNLRGADGALQVQVYADAPAHSGMLTLTSSGEAAVNKDLRGRKVRTLGQRNAVPGDTLVLTLDLDMQQAAHDALGGQRGAVVVLDARSGAVRALVSHPTFDPNAFVRPALAEERTRILLDPTHPIINRAMRSFAPGSTLKPLLAYGALANGVIDEKWTVFCPGHYTRGRRYHCWKRGGHGWVTVREGIAFSCDVFFWTLAEEMGIDAVEHTLFDFGFGTQTGLELTGESAGLVAGPTWKNQQTNLQDRSWYAGETLNAAIGQGQMLATPLQLARAYAVFLNGGTQVTPHLIDRVVSPDGSVLLQTDPRSKRHAMPGWNAKAGEEILKGLRDVATRRKPFYGTAWRSTLKHLEFVGKTGTAQVVSLVDANNRRTTEEMPYEERDNAWFVGGVIDREPRLVCAVFVEHGGHAGESALPVFDAFFRAVFPEEPEEDAASPRKVATTGPQRKPSAG